MESNWSKLLNKKRKRISVTDKIMFRNEFDKDYERIIYSSSLRRLQDKAQVFPLQENDFTRTRLTHSMEVASLGRSMAWNIASWLLEEKDTFDTFWQAKELASLVEVSSLVHDLGTPPFGHYGEDIIRKWFTKWFDSNKFLKVEKEFIERGFDPLNEQQKNDFVFFEGNAQAIRILTKLQFLNDQFGANFTYGTLATLMKYPWASDNPKTKTKKKFGYFYSENSLFKDIQREVGIGDHRHPATFLLEAADDIAYLTADVEDGVKKGIIPWEEVYNEEIKNYLKKNHEKYYDRLESYKEKARTNNVPKKDRALVSVQNFKVIAQGIMITSVVDNFKENYSSIMNGNYSGSLLNNSSANPLREILKKIAIDYVYNDNEVLTLELVGDKVLTDLLDLFIDSVVSINDKPKSKTKEEKLFHLISPNHRHIHTLDNDGYPNVEIEQLSLYNRLLLVTDFISGMTDSYAVNLHQKLLGVKLP